MPPLAEALYALFQQAGLGFFCLFSPNATASESSFWIAAHKHKLR